MSAGLYLKAGWLYIVGVIVVIVGLYMLFAMALYDLLEISNAFYVMFFGFAISIFGGIRGKKIIRSPEFRDRLKKERKKKKEKEIEKVKEEALGRTKAEKIEGEILGYPEAPSVPETSGENVIKVIICPHCGEENKYTARFCNECGKPLRPKKKKR